jgi:glycosyltransferase involved in cell wall biosynthesis
MNIAVVIPCFNEEATIGKVVADFRAALPDGVVYVYDNNSADRTAERAATAGAVVRYHSSAGKGEGVRRAFADVAADIYVLVDGDDTYEAAAAPALVDLLVSRQLDFVNAARRATADAAYRSGHRFGNGMFSGLVRLVFGRQFGDVLSGYKVLSRRFVKSFPAASNVFEIETELAVHSLELNVPSAERIVAYRERPAGSHSKLHTVRDGLRILLLVAYLIRNERPFAFFGIVALLLLTLSLALGIPVVLHYLATGLVPRLPTAVLSASLALLAAMSVMLGLMLQTVTRLSRDVKRLAYLAQPAIRSPDQAT